MTEDEIRRATQLKPAGGGSCPHGYTGSPGLREHKSTEEPRPRAESRGFVCMPLSDSVRLAGAF